LGWQDCVAEDSHTRLSRSGAIRWAEGPVRQGLPLLGYWLGLGATAGLIWISYLLARAGWSLAVENAGQAPAGAAGDAMTTPPATPDRQRKMEVRT
jgi:hypothetical protein